VDRSFAFFTPEWRRRRREEKVSGRIHSVRWSVKRITFLQRLSAPEKSIHHVVLCFSEYTLSPTHTCCADAVQFYHRIHPPQAAPLFFFTAHKNYCAYIDCCGDCEEPHSFYNAYQIQSSRCSVCRTMDGEIASRETGSL
jgi:hypothetical protein